MPFNNPLSVLTLAKKLRIASVNEQPSEFQADQFGYLAVRKCEVVYIESGETHN